MTQEELSADSWAWRKYGQKPIKGSPYPRLSLCLLRILMSDLFLHFLIIFLTKNENLYMLENNFFIKHFSETTTGAAPRKAAPPGNRWSAAQMIPKPLWSHTPANTLTPAQLTGAHSPEAPEASSLLRSPKGAAAALMRFYLKRVR